MAPDFCDGAAPARRRGMALAPAMLAIIRELGPVDHIAALHQLKAQGRVRLGVRAADARVACVWLAQQGQLERVGQWEWRVPSDSAVIIPEDGHDNDAAVASPLAARAG